jgi:FtsH-binding integral membrane protein
MHASDSENETQPLNPTAQQLKDVSAEIRLGFVRKVYGILCAQLLLTVLIATPIALSGRTWIMTHRYIMYVSMFAVLAMALSMMCLGKLLRTFPGNYIFLFVFTSLMAVMVGFTSAMYTWQSVVLAAGATLAIFVLLTIYAVCFAPDFTGFGPYLFAALSALLVWGFIAAILSLCGAHVHWMMIVYDIVGTLIFSFYIVYDTQLIIGEYGGHKVQFDLDDYCFAALNLYLDIVNLFLLLLELMGDRK